MVCWGGGSTGLTDVIGIPRRYARCLGLDDGDRVKAYKVGNGRVAEAERVELEPASKEDEEVLEGNLELVERVLLNQWRVVSLGAAMPVSVSANCAITLRCIDARPGGIVRINDGSELLVKPRQRRRAEPAAPDEHDTAGPATTLLVRTIRWNAMSDGVSVAPSHAASTHVGDDAAGASGETSEDMVVPSCCVRLNPRDAACLGDSIGTGALVTVTSAAAGSGAVSLSGEGHHLTTPRRRRATMAVAIVEDDGSVREEHAAIPVAMMAHLCIEQFDCVSISAFDVPENVDTTPAPPGMRMQTSSIRMSPMAVHPLVPMTRASDDGNVLSSGEGDASRNMTMDETAGNMRVQSPLGTAALVEAFFAAHAGLLIGLKHGFALPVSAANGAIVHVVRRRNVSHVTGNRVVRKKSCNTDDEEMDHMFYMLRQGAQDLNGAAAMVGADDARVNGVRCTYGNVTAAVGLPETMSSSVAAASTVLILHQDDISVDLKGGHGEDMRVCAGKMLRWTARLPGNVVGPLEVSSLGWLRGAGHRAITCLAPRLEPWWASENVNVAPLPGCPLLCGGAGGGKTTAGLAVLRSLETRSLVRVARIDCGALARVHRAGTAQRALIRAMRHAAESPPCVLLLDDLHILCPSGKGESEGEGGSDPATELLRGSVTTSICDAIDDFLSRGAGFGLIATSSGPTDVHASLTAAGRFDSHIALRSPGSSDERADVVRRAMCGAADEDAVDALAHGSDGVGGVADVRLLCERALHAAHLRAIRDHRNASPTLTPRCGAAHLSVEDTGDNDARIALDVLRVTRGDALAALRSSPRKPGQPMPSPSAAGTADEGAKKEPLANIGGLRDVKRALHDAFALPVLHEDIFGSCPLRLRRSVLLHGPPGCGKTLVATSIAKLLSASVAQREGRSGDARDGGSGGVRTITVKGPELLNKYIGESEASVRALFARARDMLRSGSARHVVVLLDEMDSVAPRRGADSTGVTDRVVNALLTEIDGVEDNAGLVPDDDDTDDESDGDEKHGSGDFAAVHGAAVGVTSTAISNPKTNRHQGAQMQMKKKKKKKTKKKSIGGLYVVGTSSRPDLIDPALLRPGRIDMHLLCPLPSFEDRLSILELFVRRLPFCANTGVHEMTETLRDLAARTEDMSSAEIRGIVRDAHLATARASDASPSISAFFTQIFSEVEVKRRDASTSKTTKKSASLSPMPSSALMSSSPARVTLS